MKLKTYAVDMVAENESGREVRFTVYVSYDVPAIGPRWGLWDYEVPRDPRCIPESEREADAISDAKRHHPHWKNFRALRSIAVDR